MCLYSICWIPLFCHRKCMWNVNAPSLNKYISCTTEPLLTDPNDKMAIVSGTLHRNDIANNVHVCVILYNIHVTFRVSHCLFGDGGCKFDRSTIGNIFWDRKFIVNEKLRAISLSKHTINSTAAATKTNSTRKLFKNSTYKLWSKFKRVRFFFYYKGLNAPITKYFLTLTYDNASNENKISTKFFL